MAITIAGSGIVEANLADNAVTLAKMASGTDGEILTYDASGNPTSVSVGTDGQVLTSTGVGSPPAFEAAAAGGKVLQVVTAQASSQVDLSTNTWTSTGLNVSITPSKTSSKILIIVGQSFRLPTNNRYIQMQLYRGTVSSGTVVYNMNEAVFMDGTVSNITYYVPMTAVDSPNTTSATIYDVGFKPGPGGPYTVRANSGARSTITAIEIGA
jgi:hypothetical protein